VQQQTKVVSKRKQAGTKKQSKEKEKRKNKREKRDAENTGRAPQAGGGDGTDEEDDDNDDSGEDSSGDQEDEQEELPVSSKGKEDTEGKEGKKRAQASTVASPEQQDADALSALLKQKEKLLKEMQKRAGELLAAGEGCTGSTGAGRKGGEVYPLFVDGEREALQAARRARALCGVQSASPQRPAFDVTFFDSLEGRALRCRLEVKSAALTEGEVLKAREEATKAGTKVKKAHKAWRTVRVVKVHPELSSASGASSELWPPRAGDLSHDGPFTAVTVVCDSKGVEVSERRLDLFHDAADWTPRHKLRPTEDLPEFCPVSELPNERSIAIRNPTNSIWEEAQIESVDTTNSGTVSALFRFRVLGESRVRVNVFADDFVFRYLTADEQGHGPFVVTLLDPAEAIDGANCIGSAMDPMTLHGLQKWQHRWLKVDKPVQQLLTMYEARWADRFAKEKQTLADLQQRAADDEAAVTKHVRAQHRRLALQLHPDKLRRVRTAEDERQFELLTDAFKVLGSSQERRKYFLAAGHEAFLEESAEAEKEAAKVEAKEEAARQSAEAEAEETSRQKLVDAHWGASSAKNTQSKLANLAKQAGGGASKPAAEGAGRIAMAVQVDDDAYAPDKPAPLFAGVCIGAGPEQQRAARGGTCSATKLARNKLRGIDAELEKLRAVGRGACSAAKVLEQERRMWELELRDKLEQVEASADIMRITSGGPNKCTLPRVVQEEAVNWKQTKRLRLHLQWKCKCGSVAVGRPDSYELELSVESGDTHDSTFTCIYAGTDSAFVTDPLADGRFCFRARALNSDGCGEWSYVNVLDLDSQQQKVDRERAYKQARAAMAQDQRNAARFTLQEVMRDFRYCGTRSEVRQQAMKADLANAMKAMKRAKKPGVVGEDLEADVALLRGADAMVREIDERSALRQCAREQRQVVEIRMGSVLSPSSRPEDAEAFLNWLGQVTCEDEGESAGGGETKRNTIFQLAMREPKQGRYWDNHLEVLRALGAREDLFSRSNLRELHKAAEAAADSRNLRNLRKAAAATKAVHEAGEWSSAAEQAKEQPLLGEDEDEEAAEFSAGQLEGRQGGMSEDQLYALGLTDTRAQCPVRPSAYSTACELFVRDEAEGVNRWNSLPQAAPSLTHDADSACLALVWKCHACGEEHSDPAVSDVCWACMAPRKTDAGAGYQTGTKQAVLAKPTKGAKAGNLKAKAAEAKRDQRFSGGLGGTQQRESSAKTRAKAASVQAAAKEAAQEVQAKARAKAQAAATRAAAAKEAQVTAARTKEAKYHAAARRGGAKASSPPPSWAPSPPLKGGFGGKGKGGGKGSGAWEPEDWPCACGNINFERRQVCNRCGKPKPVGVDPIKATAKAAVAAKAQVGKAVAAAKVQGAAQAATRARAGQPAQAVDLSTPPPPPPTPPPPAASLRPKCECPVCLEDYRSPPSARMPVNLPCGHSLCQGCVRQMCKRTGGGRTARVQCPECRRVLELPPAGVGALPCNYSVVQMIEQFAQDNAVAQRKKKLACTGAGAGAKAAKEDDAARAAAQQAVVEKAALLRVEQAREANRATALLTQQREAAEAAENRAGRERQRQRDQERQRAQEWQVQAALEKAAVEKAAAQEAAVEKARGVEKAREAAASKHEVAAPKPAAAPAPHPTAAPPDAPLGTPPCNCSLGCCDEGTAASFFCTQCAEFICGGCYSAHARARASRSHAVVGLVAVAGAAVCASVPTPAPASVLAAAPPVALVTTAVPAPAGAAMPPGSLPMRIAALELTWGMESAMQPVGNYLTRVRALELLVAGQESAGPMAARVAALEQL
jgi:curved DNA-binding protein CbpA